MQNVNNKIRQQRRYGSVSCGFFILAFTLFFLLALRSAAVTLEWDPVDDPQVAGYRVYRGLASRSYSNVTDTGTNTFLVLTGLDQGVTYYFAVTCYTFDGLESDYSDEITYAAPVTSASLLITNLAQIYDGDPHTVLVIASPADLAFSVTYNGDGTPPTAAGVYTVVATSTTPGLPAAATNSLTISPASLTLTAENLLQRYDGQPKVPVISTVPAGHTYALHFSGAGNPVNSGQYAFQATSDDANYSGSITGVLVITKAPCTMLFDNLTQTYDGAPKWVDAAASEASLQIDITYNGDAEPPVNAGSYEVVATAADRNWSGSATNTLVVEKAEASIDLSGLTQTFSGGPLTISADTTPAGLHVAFFYSGDTNPPIDAGTYEVAAVIEDTNFTGSATNTLTIQKAAATVTIRNLTQLNNGGPIFPDIITVPSGLNTVVTFDGSPYAPTTSGSYAVQVAIDDNNYDGTAAGTLRVVDADNAIVIQWQTAPDAVTLESTTDFVNWTPAGTFTVETSSAIFARSGGLQFFRARAAGQPVPIRVGCPRP